MRLLYKKPEGYLTLPLEDKVMFILQCCTNRQQLRSRFNGLFFSPRESTYLATLLAIADYMRAYQDKEDGKELERCLTTGIQQYSAYCGQSCEPIPELEQLKIMPLKETDIDLAYDLLNQCFLTNNEYYWYAIRKLDFKLHSENPSVAFKTYLSGTLVTARRKWEACFPDIRTCNDLLSEKIRPVLKATLVLSCALAFACYGIETASRAYLLVVLALYSISGELSDNIANIFSKPPVQKADVSANTDDLMAQTAPSP